MITGVLAGPNYIRVTGHISCLSGGGYIT